MFEVIKQPIDIRRRIKTAVAKKELCENWSTFSISIKN